jgi:hypothetical protein
MTVIFKKETTEKPSIIISPLNSTYKHDSLNIYKKGEDLVFSAVVDWAGNEFTIKEKEFIKLIKRLN